MTSSSNRNQLRQRSKAFIQRILPSNQPLDSEPLSEARIRGAAWTSGHRLLEVSPYLLALSLGAAIVGAVSLALAPELAAGVVCLLGLLLLGLRWPAHTLIVGGFLALQVLKESRLSLPLGPVSAQAFVIFTLLTIACLAILRMPFVVRHLSEIVPFAVLALVAVISIMWAENHSLALREAVHYVYPVLFYVVISAYVWTLRNQMLGIRIFTASFVIALFVAVLDRMMESSGTYESFSNTLRFVNPNRYGLPIGLLVLGVISFFGYASRGRQLRAGWRLGSLAVAVAASALVVMTLTRAYIFGLIGASATFFWLSTRKREGFGGVRKLAVASAVVFLVAVLLTFESPVKRRMFWAPRSIALSDLRSRPSLLLDPDVVVMSGRSAIWTSTTKAIGGGGLLGSGAGSTRAYLERQPFGRSVQVMHGEFARIWAEFGILGSLVYLSALSWILLQAISGAKRTRGSWAAHCYAISAASVVFLVIAGLTYDMTNSSPGFTEYVLLFFGSGKALEAHRKGGHGGLKPVHREADLSPWMS